MAISSKLKRKSLLNFGINKPYILIFIQQHMYIRKISLDGMLCKVWHTMVCRLCLFFSIIFNFVTVICTQSSHQTAYQPGFKTLYQFRSNQSPTHNHAHIPHIFLHIGQNFHFEHSKREHTMAFGCWFFFLMEIVEQSGSKMTLQNIEYFKFSSILCNLQYEFFFWNISCNLNEYRGFFSCKLMASKNI